MGDKIEAIKAEFRKIIWPDQRTVMRETIAVCVSGLGLGLVLALMDTVIKFGLGFIL